MAELPAPPAPVDPVEIAEELVAGAVPAGAEMKLPPEVEAEVFPLLLFLDFFFVYLLHVFGIP